MELFDLKASLTLDSSDYESNIKSASEAQSLFAEDIDRVVGSTDNMEQALIALQQEYNENEMRAKELKAAMDELANGGDTSSTAFQELSYNLAETQQYSDALTDKMKALSSAEKENDKSASGAGKSTSFFGDMIKANLGSEIIKKGIEMMKQLVVETAEYGDAIDKQSQKLGISASAYQEWEAVLQHSGSSMSSMSATFKTLANAAQDASDDQVAAFERIGLSMDEVANMATEDLFGAVIMGLQNMEEGTERTALATDLLGRGAMELGPLLNTTADETQAMIDRVNELGGVMSQDGVDASADFQDAVQDLKTAFQASARDIGTAVLPVLTDIINGATDAMAAMRNVGVDETVNDYEDVADRIRAARQNIEEWNDKIQEATKYGNNATYQTQGYINAVEQLNAILDEAGTKEAIFEELADGQLTTKEAADLLGISIEQMYRQLRGAAEEERRLAEATEETTDEIDEQAEAAKEAHDAIIDIASAAIDAKYSGDDLREAYNDLSSELDKLRETGEAYDIQLAEQELAVLNLAATNQELADGFPILADRLQNQFGISLTQTSSWLISHGMTAEEWGNQVNTATDNVINGFSELDTDLGLSLDEMAANMQSNIDAYTNWEQNIHDMMTAAQSITDESSRNMAIAFVQHMQDMGIGAADQVAAMAEDIPGTLETFGPLMGDAIDVGMWDAYQAIENSDLDIASTEMMDKAVQAIEDTDFETPGGNVSQEVATGISNNEYLVTNAASGVVTSAYNSANSYTSDFYYVGYAMDTQMVAGIKAGATAVADAAAAVARRAYDKAKSVLGSADNSAQNNSYYGGSHTTNNYFEVNGTENPEDYANRLARQLNLQMRMA